MPECSNARSRPESCYHSGSRQPVSQRKRSSSFVIDSSVYERRGSSISRVAAGSLPPQRSSMDVMFSGPVRGHRSVSMPSSFEGSSFQLPNFGRSSSENWNSFHKRFQTKKKREEKRGIRRSALVRLVNRMFMDCTRPNSFSRDASNEDDCSQWVESEVDFESDPADIHHIRWMHYKAHSDDQERRLELIE